MTRRESLLVSVLAAVAAAAFVVTAFAFQLDRRAETRQRIAVMTGELEKLQARGGDEAALRRQRDKLSAERARELARFYPEREMDTFRFGTLIRTLLIREGLEISRYRTLESASRTLLEFTVSGSALETARFLERVADSDHVWIVPSLSIDSHGPSGELRSVFRIGYETIDDVAR